MRILAVLAILAALAAAGAGLWVRSGGDTERSAVPAEAIALGRKLYAEHCAGCHGPNLEGQPNWRRRLPSGRMPAPPHDASGHTWHHSDDTLFRITKEGAAAIIGGGYESDMRGFGGVLSDGEIRAVLTFIKSTWPAGQREAQPQTSRGALTTSQ
ncbi:MAG: cytochrome c [Rhodomicrobium sp.]|nr:cytochrome c [Rhodomicrobium sp.]